MKRSQRRKVNNDTTSASRVNLYTAVVQRVASTVLNTYINVYDNDVATLLSDLSSSNRMAKFRRVTVEFNPMSIPLTSNIQTLTAQLQIFDIRTGEYVPKTDLVPISTTKKTRLSYSFEVGLAANYRTTANSRIFRLVLLNSQDNLATAMRVPYTIYADVSLSRDVPSTIV